MMDHNNKSKLKSDSLPRKPSAVWAAIKTVKTKLSLTDEGGTPVNWKVVFLVFLSLFSSSFNITFIFPFLPEMILTFGYTEEEKGFYAGIVASALFVGRAFGSYFWGWLSDKKGRRPIVLLTLLLNGLFSLGFGFTTNIYFAIIFRVLAGLANGTVGTAKTILYEISDNTNQAVGMSIISVAWGSGLIVGPAIGGYLANPCKRYPDVFPAEGFLLQFPYIFPGVIAFVICFVAFIVDFIWLPETLSSKVEEQDVTVEACEEGEDETTSLHSGLRSPRLLRVGSPKAALSVENLHVEAEGATYLAGSRKEIHITMHGITFTDTPENVSETSPLSRDSKTHLDTDKGHFYLDNAGLKSRSLPARGIVANGQAIERTDLDDTSAALLENGVVGEKISLEEKKTHRAGSCCSCCNIKNWSAIQLLRQYDVFLAVFLYSTFSFSVIGVEEIFTVWSSTDVALDGLGFEPQQIGTVLGSTSLPLLFLQLFIFPVLIRHIGIKKTLVLCSVILVILTDALPVLHLLVNKPVVLWVLLLSGYTLIKLMISLVFSCTGLLINNSVTPDHAGSVNGLAMTLTAVTRSFAPIIGGTIFSWVVRYGSVNIGPPFDVSLVFFIFGIIYWVVALVGVVVPESLNKQKK